MAIKHSRPERFITWTRVGDEWQTIRRRMFQVRHDVGDLLGRSCEIVWSVERNPRGTGHHVHAWQRGEFIAQADLSRLAARRGMGERVDIRRWHAGGESYALKEAYAVKGSTDAEYFLGMNGGRLTHQSRGYFGTAIRQAERAAVAAELGDELQTWELVTVSELHRALVSQADG